MPGRAVLCLWLAASWAGAAGAENAARTPIPRTGDPDLNAFLDCSEQAEVSRLTGHWFEHEGFPRAADLIGRMRRQSDEDLARARPAGPLKDEAAALDICLAAFWKLREEALSLINDERRYPEFGKEGQSAVDLAVEAVRKTWKDLRPRIEEHRAKLGEKVYLRRRGLFFAGLAGGMQTYLAQLLLARQRQAAGAAETPSSGDPPPAATAPDEAAANEPYPALMRELKLWDGLDRAGERTRWRAVALAPFEKENVEAVNAYRLMLGRAPLAVHGLLIEAARKHSLEMREKGYFSHVSPTPGLANPQQRIAAEGYQAYSTGENIAAGKFSPQEVFAGWYRSAGHHRNLLRDSYLEIGVGVVGPAGGNVSAEVRTWWTQNFGSGNLAPARVAARE